MFYSFYSCVLLSSNRSKCLNSFIFRGLATKSQVDWTVVRCGIQSGNAWSHWPAVYSGHDGSDICLKLSDDMWWLFSNLMCKCQFDMFADVCFQSRTSRQCCDMDSAEIQTKVNFMVISSLPTSDDCFLLISTMSSRRSPFPRYLSLSDFGSRLRSPCVLWGGRQP